MQSFNKRTYIQSIYKIPCSPLLSDYPICVMHEFSIAYQFIFCLSQYYISSYMFYYYYKIKLEIPNSYDTVLALQLYTMNLQ